MKFDSRSLTPYAAAMLSGVIGFSTADGGCPCNKGNSGSNGMVTSPYPMAAYPETMPTLGMPAETSFSAGYGMNNQLPSVAGPSSIGPGYSAATATTWQPPPGSLGQTYQMKSRPVPVKMHPRAAILDVKVVKAKDVRVHDMNVYRTQDFLEGFQDDQDAKMWHFSTEPLIPGIPHIYRIEARFDGPDGEKMEERYVRLIMGRAIEISF